MLKIEHLSKKYNTKQALKNIDLEIPQGQIIGLFGETTDVMMQPLYTFAMGAILVLSGLGIKKLNATR